MKLFSISAAYLAVPMALLVSAQTQQMNKLGCYTDGTGFENKGSYTYQSLGYCAKVCSQAKAPYMGLHDGAECWCGTSLPDKKSLQPDDKCNKSCTGWPEDHCGSDTAWSVYQLPAVLKDATESVSASTSLASATPGSNSTASATTASATKSGSASQSASSTGATPTTSTSAATRRFKLPFFL
ncbi:WSC domain-containing protein [Aspergillus pseudonomiae]|uniref:WSC domain-containing protein n=1 Tax=Aspergillus pseudonomiae TaxID=1506151 RepID=A0A5N6HKE7_9EURO|nr:WSC domain-containing protein [Aspergillus pseudonomiae]KAB8254992.1 WSC domain-containing protein [Aspergillus pseudonomiae]KAE8409371.1 WSC domain-containing protein [Aspergillus pseudonomiae]